MWATIQKKNGRGRYGDLYLENEIIELSAYRRILAQNKRDTEEIIKLMEYTLYQPREIR